MNVVMLDDDDFVDGEITSEQEKQLQQGKFSGELCGGAVKARCATSLAAALQLLRWWW